MNTQLKLKELYMTAALLILNLTAFAVELSAGPEKILPAGGSTFPLSLGPEPWRLLTSMFLHFSPEHLFSNMLALFVTGSIIERAFGHGKFLLIYFVSGIAAGFVSCLWHRYTGEAVLSAGASGAVFSLTGSLLAMALFHRTAEFGIDAKRVPLAVLLTLLAGMETNVDTAAHTGGLLAGFLISVLFLMISKRPDDQPRDPVDL